ncbi:MAG: ABC transporter ATP-binding protein [Candidatus Cloacimonadota bacterium]|nr:MAG: ABC transporter ATP-binding protein [Candidatus Cloacimonadota bacterium]
MVMSVFEEQDYKKRFDWQLWKKLFRYLKPYKKHLAVLGVVVIILAGIDTVFPLMTKLAVDSYIVPRTFEGLWKFGFLFALLVIVQAVVVWLFIAIAGKIDMGICYDIRKRGFERLQELSFTYYDRTQVGWIMARMTSDISRLGDTIAWGLVDMIWGFTMMLAMAVVMFVLNWKLAFLTLSVVPVLAVLSLYFQKKILKWYRIVRKSNSRITGGFNEGITGAKTTKTLAREQENLREFQAMTSTMYHSSVRAAVLSSMYLPAVLTLGSIGTALALWYGGKGVLAATISYGTLLAFISYTVQFFEPVREIARIFAELQSAQASAERTLSMIETKPDITDSAQVIKTYGTTYSPKKDRWPEMAGNITFRNVSFAYSGGQKVLTQFNLDVKAGETIALVGETGSGKSTIVNLACRFYEPTEGEILIDGVDYRERTLLWLHSNLGYVLQTPHLFSGAIEENIRYGKLEATDKEIEGAARLVNAHNFIMNLEDGYQTDVGEGGGRLSTGEKQLISFARAILADPRIFVLDEATSSIDTESEKIIQEAIEQVLAGRTSFIIAHRLSTIRSADRILVIRDGRVIEEGDHHNLLKQKGYYYKLYTNQFMDEQETRLINA